MKSYPKIIDKILEEISIHHTFCIVGHVRPDGDCVGSQLGLANTTQCLGARMPRVTRRQTVVSPALTSRRGDEVGLDALGCVPGKHATASEGLVIRVGEDPHESKWVRLAGGFGFVHLLLQWYPNGMLPLTRRDLITRGSM